MAIDRVYTFPNIGSLTLETIIPSPRRSNSEPPTNLSFTVAQLITILEANGFVVLPSLSTYVSNDAAITAGLSPGDWYLLAPANEYGIPVPPGGTPTVVV